MRPPERTRWVKADRSARFWHVVTYTSKNPKPPYLVSAWCRATMVCEIESVEDVPDDEVCPYCVPSARVRP